MPRRMSASARFGPTPFRNLTGLASVSAVPFPLPPSLFPSFGDQTVREPHGVEQHEVVEGLAGAEEANRRGHRATQRDDAAAFRGAIELRDHEPRERHGGRELACLVHRVLADGRVQHQQRFVRRAGLPFPDHARQLLELLAQVSSCSVAPARKVSAAASSTLRPSRLSRCASLATVVVFPVPLTPKTSTTVGGLSDRASGGAAGPSSSTTIRSSVG